MATMVVSYLPPTNARGARVSAKLSSGKGISIPWDHALSEGENFDVAAAALAKKWGWGGEGMKFYRGGLKGGAVVYVTPGQVLEVDSYKREEVAKIVKKLRVNLHKFASSSR